MSNLARAWKDEAYRQSLSVEEQAKLPANPVGEIELTEAELDAISGAHWGGRYNQPSETDQALISQRNAFATNGFNNVNAVPTGLGTLTINQTGNTCNDDFDPSASAFSFDGSGF